jgi:hypothetical protein
VFKRAGFAQQKDGKGKAVKCRGADGGVDLVGLVDCPVDEDGDDQRNRNTKMLTKKPQ